MLRIAALAPRRPVRPSIDIDALAEAKPHRVHVVRVRLREPELALQKSRAPRRIDHPTRLQALRLAVELIRNVVTFAARAKLNAANARAIDEPYSERARMLTEVVLEDAPIELVGRCG